MSTTREILVPDIGDFENVDVIEVLVKPGDTVSAEDPLITLESDKATMDVPSPASGKVREIKISVGDKVSEGSLVAVIEAEDAAAEPAKSEPAPATPEPAAPAPVTASAPAPVAATAPAAADVATPPPPQSLPAAPALSSGQLPHASPSVRRFARELGVDLTQVKGSGPRGRILQDDVRAFVKTALRSGGPTASTTAGIPTLPEIDFSKWGPIDVQPLSRIKKISGKHLHRAWLNVPHVTHHDESDITDLESFRQSLKEQAAKSGVRVTLLAFVLKAVASALKAYPTFNASLAPDGESLVLKNYFHIGVAVDTDGGLVVPVIRDVDRKGVMELAKDLGDVSARARDGKLKPDEMQGGCFSISSLGGIGGTAFTPIVNAPEVAILGLTRAKMAPVWNGKEFQPRLMLPMDLSYDHRVIDGAQAARFTSHLVSVLQDARRLLL